HTVPSTSQTSTLSLHDALPIFKGAYWDTEIKRAQVLGLEGFPVFTRKCNTDVSYLACARKLLGLTDRIYPQFATHNAHTVASILDRKSTRLNSSHVKISYAVFC